MFVNLRGRPYTLWRVADERGAELDVLRQNCRDKSAVKSVFKSALCSATVPCRIVTETDSYAFRWTCSSFGAAPHSRDDEPAAPNMFATRFCDYRFH
ncbi:transposase [Mycetohabitans sp. B2]|nr:transposase [Mycetohabitans sp. B2]